MHFWKQNLTEHGSIWHHGRCAWFFEGWKLHLEWSFLRPFNDLAVSLSVGVFDFDELMFHFSLPRLVGIFIGVHHPKFNRGYEREREISFTIDPKRYHWRLWTNPNEGYFCWRDNGGSWERIIKGRSTVSSRVLEERDVIIPMPEGPYEGHGTLEECTETFRRWPIKRQWTIANIDIEKGIPEPGKGENSWDMDDDATFGMSGPATSIEELVPRIVESVERQRERYGGSNWIPDKGW